MSRSAEKFAELLTEAIHAVRVNEGKTVRLVQDELGYTLGRNGGSAVERWRKGNLPPHAQDVEAMARFLVERGHLTETWLTAFLDAAGYPQPAALIQQLCGSSKADKPPRPEVQPLQTAGFTTSIRLSPAPQAVTLPPPTLFPRPVMVFSALLFVALLFALVWVTTPLSPSEIVQPLPTLAAVVAPSDQQLRLAIVLQSPDPLENEQLLRSLPLAWDNQTSEKGLFNRTTLQLGSWPTPTLSYPPELADLVVEWVSPESWRAVFTRPEEQRVAQMVANGLPVSSDLAADLEKLAQVALGTQALDQGDYPECVRRLGSVLEAEFPLRGVLFALTGRCLDALGRPEEAYTHYQQAVALDKNATLGYYGLGNYWYSQRDFAQATQFYEQAIHHSPLDPLSNNGQLARAYAGLGNIALAQKRWAESVAYFEQALALDEQAPFYLGLALAYQAGEQWPNMIEAAELCVNLARPLTHLAYEKAVLAECERLLIYPTVTPLPTNTHTPAPPTPAVTVTFTPLPPTLPPTMTPSRVFTLTPMPTPTPTPAAPTSSPAEGIPTSTPEPATPLPSASPTFTPSPTHTASATVPPTIPPQPTLTPSFTPTHTPSPSPTHTATSTLPPTIPATTTPSPISITVTPIWTVTLPPTIPVTPTTTP